MSGPRDMVRGQQANLIKERAGVPSARSNAQQIAVLRAPKAPGVANKPIITGKLADGSAAAAMLAIGDRQGLWNNQSQRGDDGIASARDDTAVPGTDVNTLSDGAVQVWSDAAASWVPGGPVDVRTYSAVLSDGVVATTTANVTYQSGIDLPILLAPGVWTAEVDTFANFRRGVAGTVDFQIYVGGSAVTASYVPVDSQVTLYTAARTVATVTGIAGGGTVHFESRYKNNSGANTITCKNPVIRVTLTRTA